MERTIDTKIGPLKIKIEEGYLVELSFEQGEQEDKDPLLDQVEREIQEYLHGTRKEFSIPIKPKGTEFQKMVWNALLEIPYGQTCSYGEIAEKIGNPKSSRAVGQANHNNPISIIIPCHRVIGKSGALTGYGGGLDKKEYLLQLEEKYDGI
ncbi:MAG: methylated-DNA--[protein]-cysteine S-methyltransferase [Tissierellia bacterium]|nr:methylated-DNA--[protein]-cysteine S-methyltransferase [Tissierellia bacterium]